MGAGMAVYIHCFHIHLTFWFLLRLLLNNLRNLFIFSINVDIDEMLLLQKERPRD